MNNILITGGTGFLGRILKDELESKRYNISDINSFSRERIDISRSFNIDSFTNFEIVIHIAGKAHSIPKNKEEEQTFYNVNFHGTKNLCSAIELLNFKPKSFIFISTVSVYGLDKGENINEGHPLLGDSPYAKSKILAEEFLIKWAKDNNIILGILRLPLIAGSNPPGNLGAMIKAIKTGRYLSIGKADAKKSIVWAKDIADIIPKLAEVGGTYNLTDGYNPSFGELERAISSSLGKSFPKKIPLSIAKTIAKVGDLLGSKAPINTNKLGKITSTLTFDDSKARQLLNWKPTKVLDKMYEII